MKIVYGYVGFIVVWILVAVAAILTLYGICIVLKTFYDFIRQIDAFNYYLFRGTIPTDMTREIYVDKRFEHLLKNPKRRKYLFLFRLRNIKRTSKK